MSTIAHKWQDSIPPKPDVYMTRRGKTRYHTLRYWDGIEWWQIEVHGRGSQSFSWPKGSCTPCPGWVSKYSATLSLRRINDPYQKGIQWGIPYTVYTEKEVLAHLVKIGELPADWRTAYHYDMHMSKKKK